MMAFVHAVPQAGAVIADLIARNLDWPGAEAIAERLQRALPPGLAVDGLAQAAAEAGIPVQPAAAPQPTAQPVPPGSQAA